MKVVCVENEVGAVCRSNFHSLRSVCPSFLNALSEKKTSRKPPIFYPNSLKKLTSVKNAPNACAKPAHDRATLNKTAHRQLHALQASRKRFGDVVSHCGCRSMRCYAKNSTHLVNHTPQYLVYTHNYSHITLTLTYITVHSNITGSLTILI